MTAADRRSCPPGPAIELRHGLAGLPSPLRQAFEQAEREDVQYGLDWLQLLTDTALAGDGTLELRVARRGERVAAVLPLLRVHGPHGPEYRSPANFYTTRSLPMPGLAADDAEAALMLLRHLRHSAPRAHRLSLAPIDRSHPAFERTRAALREAGYLVFDYFCYGNWTHAVDGDAEAYLATRPGEVRSTLRRMARRLERAGGRVEIVGPEGDVEAALAAFQAVYARSWKVAEPHPAFVPGLVRLCARRGWLRMGLAWLDGRPIAAQLWLVAHGRAQIYKLAYDEAHAGLSPGTVLTGALMRHAIDVDRVREIDYLTGDDAYKAAWMSRRRELWGLLAYDPARMPGLAGAAREAAARAVRRLQRPFSGPPTR
jgi:CelD/BcsL family acetyltransferase involved in cellulose biosynthesis